MQTIKAAYIITPDFTKASEWLVEELNNIENSPKAQMYQEPVFLTLPDGRISVHFLFRKIEDEDY